MIPAIESLRAQLDELEQLMTRRRNPDKASTLLTDCFLEFRALSDQLARQASQYTEDKPSRQPVEEDKELPLIDRRTPLSALEGEPLDPDHQPSKDTWELVLLLRTGTVEDGGVLLQSRLNDAIRNARLVTLRAMIRHIWQDASDPWEMMKHALAITRQYHRSSIKGVSLTELAILLNETRAAPSARERKLHDSLLERWGVKGLTAADGALKSKTTRERCRAAQIGNRNRKRGERRKRRERKSRVHRKDSDTVPAPSL